MNQSILSYCIKSKPKLNLKGCLSYYDNSRLVEIAEKQQLLLNMGGPIVPEKINSKEVIESLYTRIQDNFKRDLFYLPPREIEFVSQLMSSDFKVEDSIDYEDCSFLYALGYIHLYHYNGQIYPVIPKELRKIYNEIPKNELEDEIEWHNSLYAYAIALTQLHGIYTLEHFMEVWNLHEKEKIELEDAFNYFVMMYDRQNYFNYDYQYIVTNYPTNNDGYKLLDENGIAPSYIPTKDELESYAKRSLGQDSPYYERLSKLI